jgi:hypothetical protein
MGVGTRFMADRSFANDHMVDCITVLVYSIFIMRKKRGKLQIACVQQQQCRKVCVELHGQPEND